MTTHACSQGAAAAQVAQTNATRIGPPGDLRFRAGLLDHEIPGAALHRAKERDGPFDRTRNQIARAEVEAVFRLRKQRLSAARATDVNQLLPSKLIGAVFNRARIAVSARVGVEQAAIDLHGAIEREGELLPGMMDAAGEGPLLKSADKDELIVSSSHFEVGVAAALARADQGQGAWALEMERALHSCAEFHADEFQVSSHFQRSHPHASQALRWRFRVTNGEREKGHGQISAVHR